MSNYEAHSKYEAHECPVCGDVHLSKSDEDEVQNDDEQQIDRIFSNNPQSREPH